MKKTLGVILILGLLVGAMSLPAEAGKKKKKKKPTVREVVVRYENPAFGVGGVGGGCSGCPSVPTGPDERFAIIQIKDDVSPSGYVSFAYDSDGDGVQNLTAGPSVRGETPEPVAMEPNTSYTAWPWAAGTGCPGSSSTSGEIRVLVSSDADALKKAAGL